MTQRSTKIVPERMKIQRSQKRVFNLYNMTKCVIQIKTLNHGLVLQKKHKVIKFSQDVQQKSYIGFHAEIRAIAIINFGKELFKLMNNSVLRKSMENVRKYRNIKFVTTEWERNYLVPKPN